MRYKFKCKTCGTEVYSNTKPETCGCCGSDEIAKFKATDVSSPVCSDFSVASTHNHTNLIIRRVIGIASAVLIGIGVATLIAVVL